MLLIHSMAAEQQSKILFIATFTVTTFFLTTRNTFLKEIASVDRSIID